MNQRFKYYCQAFIMPILPWIILMFLGNTHLAVVLLSCLIIDAAIVFINNPKAMYYRLKIENTVPKEKTYKVLIESVLLILCGVLIYATIQTLDSDYRFDLNTLLVFIGIVLSLLLLIGLSIYRRRWFQKNIDVPVSTFEDVFNYIDNIIVEEKLSIYVRLKSFDTLAEAEDLKKTLEDNGIPSMIYGANKIDYISREVLPVQVMVTKKNLNDAQRFV